MKRIEMKAFGSVLTGREYGKAASRKVLQDEQFPCILDFSGVSSMGSSFGDELLPAVAGRQGGTVYVTNINSAVKNCLDDVVADVGIRMQIEAPLSSEVLSFPDLVSKVCAGRVGGGHSLTGGATALRYMNASVPQFVSPNLRRRLDIGETGDPSVLIISAAGAVGKSTLAQQLAWETGAPIWDLADEAPVAQNAFTGLPYKAFGPEIAANVLSELSKGKFRFIIDALDEARARATEFGFEAFIGDITQHAKSDDSNIRFVLLARTQTAEAIWLMLADAGVRAAILQIDPFAPEQALEYVETKVKGKNSETRKRIEEHREPFTQAFEAMVSRLGGQSRTSGAIAWEARAFLGYAPVLDAIAEFLAGENNFSVTQKSLELGDTTGGRPELLLLDVVRRILDRESRKQRDSFQEKLEELARRHQWAAWESLYSADEQCVRLLAYVLRAPFSLDIEMPSEIRSEYEKSLATCLPEHPFLRDENSFANVVFESFLMARALRDDIGGFRKAATQWLQDPKRKLTHLLADFYFACDVISEVPSVLPEHVGLLYESMSSADSQGHRVRFLLEGSDPAEDDNVMSAVESEADGEFELLAESQEEAQSGSSWRREFRVSLTPRSELIFPRQLRWAGIVAPCSVVFGVGKSTFRLGPGVDLRCRSLIINAEGLSLGEKSGAMSRAEQGQDSSIVLDALELVNRGLRPDALKVHGELSVSWPGAELYPWTAYAVKTQRAIRDAPPLDAAYRRFRRIALTLRSNRYGTLARLRKKVEDERTLQGPLGRALLDQLRRDGILELKEQRYTWVGTRASQLVGISWTDLRNSRASEALVAYLTDFLKTYSRSLRS